MSEQPEPTYQQVLQEWLAQVNLTDFDSHTDNPNLQQFLKGTA